MKKSAITIGQFEINKITDNNRTCWHLTQSDCIQAEGSLDYVLGIMFERIKTLAINDLKKAVEQGESTIKHTITAR